MMKYLLPVLVFIAFSCGNKHTFVVEKEMPKGDFWTNDDFVRAEFNVDKGIPYNIYFELKHTDDYPFENLYLRIIDNFTGKKDTDIVNINLANSYGIWYGDKRGDNYTFSTLLRKAFKFKDSSIHAIQIEQFTRRDSLEGVTKVSFYIDENQ